MALLKISALVTYVFKHVSFFISLPYLRFSVSDLMQMNVRVINFDFERVTIYHREVPPFIYLGTVLNGFHTNFVRILKRYTSICGTVAAIHRIKGLICKNY